MKTKSDRAGVAGPSISGPDGIVLVGGKSLRMGKNKAHLRSDDATFLEVAFRLLESVCSNVAVVGGDPDDYPDFAGHHLRDDVPDLGPIGGILTGMRWAGSPWVMVLPCDLPLMSPRILGDLAAAYVPGVEVHVAKSPSGIQPLVGKYSTALAGRMSAYANEGGRSVSGFLERCTVQVLEAAGPVAPDGDGIFLNVNTPPDLDRLRRSRG